jgi:RND family efflux transporter MFP subunit
VAKLPQLEAAKAQLAADRADLQKALLDLERTEIKAPFDGRVVDENVGVGQYVSPGQPVATIFSTEVAEIVVPLEDESLYWFHVPGFTPGDGPGAPATVSARIAGRNLTWQGRVDRSEGKVDERTRMINVIVRVEAPYATKPPLAAGLFASVEIQGRTIPEAAIVPRAALRENDRVWVVDDTGRLAFRDIKVARLYPDRAILTDGLRAGERVVISPLNTVTDGMAVRINAVTTEGAS